MSWLLMASGVVAGYSMATALAYAFRPPAVSVEPPVGHDLGIATEEDIISAGRSFLMIPDPQGRRMDELRTLRNAAGAVIGVDDLLPDQFQTATEVLRLQIDASASIAAGYARLFGEFFGEAARVSLPSSEAEQRSMELLRSRLSAAQLEEFDRLNAFDVVGSDTGKRYRITKGTVSNVLDLDAGQRMCFVPAGNLSVGDVMLAQKIALETNERAALAVANRGMLVPLADGRVIFRDATIYDNVDMLQ